MLPVKGDEAFSDVPIGEHQVVTVVSAKFDGEVGKCHQQCELVGRREIPFGEQSLQLRQELQLGFRRGGGARSGTLASRPVICSLWDDPANTASRVGDIAQKARNQMEMEVGDGLARGCAVIDADVVAIWSVRRIHRGFGVVE